MNDKSIIDLEMEVSESDRIDRWLHQRLKTYSMSNVRDLSGENYDVRIDFPLSERSLGDEDRAQGRKVADNG